MEFLNHWWGIKDDITPLEIAARSAVMFIIALLLIRMAGMRPFGKGENFDKIITFLIGAILSRGVVGATPFFSAVTSMIVIILIHKIISKLSIYSSWFGEKVKGHTVRIYEHGRFDTEAMKRHNITHKDILEDLRSNCQLDSLETIREVVIETTGKLSFVKKEN